MPQPINVLFVSTANGARSILAELLMNNWGASRFRGYSAGSAPSGSVHPYALRLLRDFDLPTEGLRSKNWNEFLTPGAPVMDFVFTLCDKVGDQPAWPGRPVIAHWGLPDPKALRETDVDQWQAFRDLLRSLENWIKPFVALPFAALDRRALEQKVEAIGEIHANRE